MFFHIFLIPAMQEEARQAGVRAVQRLLEDCCKPTSDYGKLEIQHVFFGFQNTEMCFEKSERNILLFSSCSPLSKPGNAYSIDLMVWNDGLLPNMKGITVESK